MARARLSTRPSRARATLSRSRLIATSCSPTACRSSGGPLRNYSAFGSPYDIPDFLFVGDDTSRGAGRSELALVEICAGDGTVSPGGTLRLTREGSGIRLDVADTSATEYRISRDGSPQSAGSTPHVAGPSPSLLDSVSIPDGGTWYFVARGVDDCGLEHD